jgi:GT2 family glycosyltransferase
MHHLEGTMISVIIVNFNGRHFLDECLSALLVQSSKEFETILVDNASTDGSIEHVRDNYRWVRLIENKKNLGFAGGVNEGIRASVGEYLVTLNNDTIADPRFVEELKRVMDEDPTVGMCASKMIFPDGRINSTGICISRSGAAWDRGMFEKDQGQFNKKEEVFGPCAGAALYRKRMLDEIGLFDEDFFLFMEDVDLVFRARLTGWKCVYTPSASVIHLHGGTSGFRSNLSIYYGNRNIIWCVVKNFPIWMLFLYSPWIISRNCGVIPYYIVKNHGMAIIRAKIDGVLGVGKMVKKRKSIRMNISGSELTRWIKVFARFRANPV